MYNGFMTVGELGFESGLVTIKVLACEVDGGSDIEILEKVGNVEKYGVAILVRNLVTIILMLNKEPYLRDTKQPQIRLSR